MADQDQEVIYLIEKTHVDPMENHVAYAVYDSIVGYALSEKEAKAFCAQGTTYTNEDCWAIKEPTPEYSYRALSRIEAGRC